MERRGMQGAATFRDQARAWLTLAGRNSAGTPRLVTFDGRPVVVAEWVNCPESFVLRDVLLVRGNFSCGPGSRFLAPVYVGGNCQLGKGSEAASLCVDGATMAGVRSKVGRWLDGLGAVDLRAGCRAENVISQTSVRIGPGAQVSMVTAPDVSSHGVLNLELQTGPGRTLLEFPSPATGRLPDIETFRGFHRNKLSPLGADTWIYDGSLSISDPIRLKAKLVVRGSFVCASGSVLEDDVKCGGTMRLGFGSESHGRLVSRGEMTLERGCIFRGELEAGLALRLMSGVRGLRDGGFVQASSRERILLEPGVAVRGKLTGSLGVVTCEPAVEGGLDLLLAQA